jgi:hypothetical protein
MTARTYTIDIDGDKFSGTALDIVTAMKDNSFFAQDQTVDDYLNNMPRQVDRLTGQAIRVTGSTLEERAESFIAEIIRVGLAEEA